MLPLIDIMDLVKEGAVFSVYRVNGSFVLEIKKDGEVTSVDLSSKSYSPDNFLEALSYLSSILQLKFPNESE